MCIRDSNKSDIIIHIEQIIFSVKNPRRDNNKEKNIKKSKSLHTKPVKFQIKSNFVTDEFFISDKIFPNKLTTKRQKLSVLKMIDNLQDY